MADALCKGVLVGAASSSFAGLFTNPIDVVKTEMQVASTTLGLLGTLRSRVARLGVVSLWWGVPAMFIRSLFYAGIRLGTYEPIKHTLATPDRPSVWSKVLAGVLSGSLGAAAANPVEVIKTRLQAGQFSSTAVAFVTVARQEGATAFGAGLVPHVLRGAAVTASQIGCYDEVKQQLRRSTTLREGLPLRFAAAMVAGVVTTTVSSPFDVLKSRAMTTGRSVPAVAAELLAASGPHGFFKGWTPQYLRLGPHTVIVFVVYDELRRRVGLGVL